VRKKKRKEGINRLREKNKCQTHEKGGGEKGTANLGRTSNHVGRAILKGGKKTRGWPKKSLG